MENSRSAPRQTALLILKKLVAMARQNITSCLVGTAQRQPGLRPFDKCVYYLVVLHGEPALIAR